MSEWIRLLRPKLPEADLLLPYLREIDTNRWYSNFGPLVQGLESRVSDMFLREPLPVQVVSVASGTAGLELALLALGLRSGARVLVPALTFIATASAVLRVGCVPLIADVDADSWLLTAEIATEILKNNRFDAVLPVATFGAPQSVAEWDAFFSKTGIPVVVDAAGAFGNQLVGLTTPVVFSLHATKALGAGEGGLIVSRQFGFAEKVRKLSNFGIDFAQDGLVFEVGDNGKMSEYHAAVAHASLDAWAEKRILLQSLQNRYCEAIAHYCPGVHSQLRSDQGVYSVFVVKLPENYLARSVQSRLLEWQIESRRWYCPTIDMHPAFSGCPRTDLLVVHSLVDHLLGLPFSVDMKDEQIIYVCRALKHILGEWSDELA